MICTFALFKEFTQKRSTCLLLMRESYAMKRQKDTLSASGKEDPLIYFKNYIPLLSLLAKIKCILRIIRPCPPGEQKQKQTKNYKPQNYLGIKIVVLKQSI